MRTSLIETEQIEQWLLKKGNVQDRVVMEARLLSNPALRDKAQWQETAYDLVRQYGREKLLDEIKAVEHTLFNTPKYKSFQDKIRSIFKR